MMKDKDIRKGIKKVYRKLRNLLSLYVETECYNKLPNGEQSEEDIMDFMDGKIKEIRKQMNILFSGSFEIRKKLEQVISETEYFIKQHECPGVVVRWRQMNPRLLYFECAFDLMETCPKQYLQMRRGLTGVRLACYPDDELLEERNDYFNRIKEKCKQSGTEYSEDEVFQTELLHTLVLVFAEDFWQYL